MCENGIYRDMTEEEVTKYSIGLPLELRVAELKQSLADTDYHILKLAEGETTLIKIAEIISKRKAWRKEINELEAVIEKGEG
jgi:hypothetical protein